MLCAYYTCAAALVDEGAQSLAQRESQIWTFVDGHSEGTSNSFERGQEVYRTCAEAGQHGPNLKNIKIHHSTTHPQKVCKPNRTE